MLRASEITRVQPSDLKEIVLPNGSRAVVLTVRYNKNEVNKLKPKQVTFPWAHIRVGLQGHIRDFMQQEVHLWSLPKKTKIIPHLRQFIDIEIVIHSFRHGRPTWLRQYNIWWVNEIKNLNNDY